MSIVTFDSRAFDRQIRHLTDLAEMVGPDGRASHGSYLKALTALHRTLLERNEVIRYLHSATSPRRHAGSALELSPLDLGAEQRTLGHAIGLIALPGARMVTFYDVLRELRATNRWWRKRIYELELAQQQRPPKELAPA